MCHPMLSVIFVLTTSHFYFVFLDPTETSQCYFDHLNKFLVFTYSVHDSYNFLLVVFADLILKYLKEIK